MYAKGSKKFLVKCFAIEDKLLVDALDEGGKEPAHIEIEYVIVPLCLCSVVISILNLLVCVCFCSDLRSMLLSPEWRVITMHSSRTWGS